MRPGLASRPVVLYDSWGRVRDDRESLSFGPLLDDSIREMKDRQRKGRVALKRRLKGLIGALAFKSGICRWLFRNKAVIVLFHRVDSNLEGNAISCTLSQFEDYLSFFSRFFRVVSLGELLERLRAGEDVSRHLVITFDDGYKDNHDLAAVALEEHGLPACFFVTTNFIGSTHVPWWDKQAAIESRWMGWDEIRSLSHHGFEIGAHTMNHVDLATVTKDDATAEILGSKRRLEEELGHEVKFFSYSYGGVHQMTQESLSMVREGGFECCVSAFGGVVAFPADPYNLKRNPISPWYISPYHFGFELMFNRT